jgi:hypothetical protein
VQLVVLLPEALERLVADELLQDLLEVVLEALERAALEAGRVERLLFVLRIKIKGGGVR